MKKSHSLIYILICFILFNISNGEINTILVKEGTIMETGTNHIYNINERNCKLDHLGLINNKIRTFKNKRFFYKNYTW